MKKDKQSPEAFCYLETYRKKAVFLQCPSCKEILRTEMELDLSADSLPESLTCPACGFASEQFSTSAYQDRCKKAQNAALALRALKRVIFLLLLLYEIAVAVGSFSLTVPQRLLLCISVPAAAFLLMYAVFRFLCDRARRRAAPLTSLLLRERENEEAAQKGREPHSSARGR